MEDGLASETVMTWEGFSTAHLHRDGLLLSLTLFVVCS